jgi:Cft2 family RNA processing exonuclease
MRPTASEGHRYLPTKYNLRRLPPAPWRGDVASETCERINTRNFREKTSCDERQHVTNTKYPQARDWSAKTRDEGYFVTVLKKVYQQPKTKRRPHQALPHDSGKVV